MFLSRPKGKGSSKRRKMDEDGSFGVSSCDEELEEAPPLSSSASSSSSAASLSASTSFGGLRVSIPAPAVPAKAPGFNLNPFVPAPSPLASLAATPTPMQVSGAPDCSTPREQMMGGGSAAGGGAAGGALPVVPPAGPVRLARRPSLAETLMGRSQATRRGRGRGWDGPEAANQTNRYHSDFEELKKIDEGSFGIVTKVRKRFDGCLYAVKRTRHPLGSKPAGGARISMQDVLKEVFALSSLDVCPNVVRYFNAWIEDGYGYIQMELCDYSLIQLIQGPHVALKDVLTVARHVAQGIAQLHQSSLVHMDIKPSNIFAKKNTNGDITYKIGDMGLACVATAVKGVQIEEGDVRYLAPEIFAGDHSQLPKGDVFSLGTSLLALCLRRELAGNGPEWHALRNGTFDMRGELPEAYTDDVAAFLSAMVVPDPARRRDIFQVLADPLMRSESELRLEMEREKNAQLEHRVVEMEKQLQETQAQAHAQAAQQGALPPMPVCTNHGRLARAHTL